MRRESIRSKAIRELDIRSDSVCDGSMYMAEVLQDLYSRARAGLLTRRQYRFWAAHCDARDWFRD